MWQAIAGFLKKFGAKLLKEAKKFKETGARILRKIGKRAVFKKKTNEEDQKTKRSGLLALGFFPVVATGGVLAIPFILIIVVLMVIMFLVLFVGAIIGSVRDVFASGMELEDKIDGYWQQYGIECEINDPTDSEKLGFLITYDDVWDDIGPAFQFDRETMQVILDEANECNYYTVGHISSPVVISNDNGELDFNRIYSDRVPVYVEHHPLYWQYLYALLCGYTDSTHIQADRITLLVSELEPDIPTYAAPYNDYVTEKELPIDATLYIRNGLLRERLLGQTIIIGNTRYLPNNLTYARECPVICADTYHVWDGVLTYNGSSYDYEETDSVIRNSSIGRQLDSHKAISSLMNMPDGYAYASRLSEVIADGVIDVGDNSSFSDLIELFDGDYEAINAVLSALGIRTRLSASPTGNIDPTQYGEYIDYHGDRYCIFRQYGNGKDVYWWSQNQYDHAYYGAATIHAAGCGPTSLAIVYTTLTGDIKTPVDTARYCAEHGYIANPNNANYTCGTASIFDRGAVELGLTIDYRGNGRNAIYEALPYLERGDMVVCQVGKGNIGSPIFNGSGHFLVVRGVTADGKILLADPGTSRIEKNIMEFNVEDMAEILDRPRGNGNVWAFSYSGEYRGSGVNWD